MSELPIDIQYHKLLDALLDRKVLSPKWQDQLVKVRNQITKISKDLPQLDEIQTLVHGSNLQFYTCQDIMRLLENAHEGKTTNIFGQYASELLQSWYNIIKGYQKHQAYVGEAARILVQNTTYEIPALKRTVQQNEKQVADNNRKIVDYNKNIAECKQQYDSMCRDIGIDGTDIRVELQGLVKYLPEYFNGIIEKSCSDKMKEACDYHRALQEYLQNCEIPSSSKGSKKKTSKSKSKIQISNEPLLHYIDALFRAKDHFDTVESTTGTINNEETPVNEEINWDIGVVESNDTPVEIDWDITTTEGQEDAQEISWDITTEEVQEETHEIQWDITAGTSNNDMNDESAKSKVDLIKSMDFRSNFKNDILELQAFFLQRKVELSSEDDVAYANQFQGQKAILAQQSIDTIEGYLDEVNAVLDLLNDTKFHQLIMIEHSSRYLDRLVNSLRQKMVHSKKLSGLIQEMEYKNKELSEIIATTRPKIDQRIQDTKTLKTQLEASLSPLFKGHTVHIIGEINNL